MAEKQPETQAEAMGGRYAGIDTVSAYDARNPYKPRVEAKEFGSVPLRRGFFVPPTNGFGPRTIDRGPIINPVGQTVPRGSVRPKVSKT